MKVFVYVVILVVAASIVAGFFIVGSPQTERLRKLDDRRISDLQNIQSQIVNFWQKKERLPAGSDELKDDVSGWIAPVDPETKAQYEYIIDEEKELSFWLCADFLLEGGAEFGNDYYSITPFGGYGAENWDHPRGRNCFYRTIDPELYPSLKEEAKRGI